MKDENSFFEREKREGKEKEWMEFVARAGCAHRSSYERAAVIGREIGSPETACLAFSSLCQEKLIF